MKVQPSRRSNRRAVDRLLGLGLVLLASCGSGERPENLLLITVDTLRRDHLSAYGGPVSTPWMDSIAINGARVQYAFTPTPSTGPAMASLFTGLYPWRHGVRLNAVAIPEHLDALLTPFAESDYRTAAFIASFNVDQRWGFGRHVETFHFDPSESMNRRAQFWSDGEPLTDAAIDWLAQNGDRPFAVWLHYFDPHSPYRPHPELYDEVPADLPPGTELPEAPDRLRKFRQQITNYRSEVAYVDQQIGRLLSHLEEAELTSRTAIVLTADHGEGLGQHGLMGHGRNLHDELLAVPLLFQIPGVEPGTVLDGLAQLEDVLPTVWSHFGFELPGDIDGENLLPWIRGETEDSPRDRATGLIADFPDMPDLFYLHRTTSKWIGQLEKDGVAFDLVQDPWELRALPEVPAPNRLLEILEGATFESLERTLDEESRKALEALGYL